MVILRTIFFLFYYFFKLIKQFINYHIYILFSYKLIHFKLETLKFNFLYSFAYIYIYLFSFFNLKDFLRIFSLQHYIHLEIVTYTYDIINNTLLVIYNIINPFFKNSINYLHPNIVYRRKLPINEKLANLYKTFYPVIFNYNYKNINFYNIKIYIFIKFIFLYFIIFMNFIIKNLKNTNDFINNHLYFSDKLNIIMIYCRNKKNKNNDIFIFFISILFLSYNFIIFIFFLLIYNLLNKNYINRFLFILGYIFIYIFDIIINIINKIYMILATFFKYIFIIILIYLFYKIIILYLCNNYFLNFILYSIKFDILNIILYYAE
jgi:hypothetical protein